MMEIVGGVVDCGDVALERGVHLNADQVGQTGGWSIGFFLFCFLQDKIADSHKFFWPLQRGLCTKA